MRGYVYRIIAPGSNSVYVGLSTDPKTRFRRHKSNTQRGKHENPALQNFLIKHPDAEVYFWPALDMSAEEIADEQLCREMGFDVLNIAPCGEVSPMLGRKHTSITRERLRVSHLGKTFKHSPETRAKIGDAHRGRVYSAEIRERVAAGHRGIGHTPEARARISAGLRGRPCSPETREKISAAQRGKKRPR